MHKVEMAFNKGYRVDKNGVLHGIRVEVLSPQLNVRGYRYFAVWVNAKRKNVCVHQLQAYQKFGREMFQDGVVVRHLNGDKLDNSWDNIAIGTASDNMMDVPANVRHTRSVQGGRTKSKLSIEDVWEMRRLYEEEGWKNKELMTKFGVAHSTVSLIVHRKTWRDV